MDHLFEDLNPVPAEAAEAEEVALAQQLRQKGYGVWYGVWRRGRS